MMVDNFVAKSSYHIVVYCSKLLCLGQSAMASALPPPIPFMHETL